MWYVSFQLGYMGKNNHIFRWKFGGRGNLTAYRLWWYLDAPPSRVVFYYPQNKSWTRFLVWDFAKETHPFQVTIIIYKLRRQTSLLFFFSPNCQQDECASICFPPLKTAWQWKIPIIWRCIPWKIYGKWTWNQKWRFGRWIPFSIGWCLGSMLIFQGVSPIKDSVGFQQSRVMVWTEGCIPSIPNATTAVHQLISNEQIPGCLGFIGDFITSYVGITINRYKDPY